jgi:hypothetical protein
VNNTKQAKIRITDVNDSSVTDESDNAFLIRGSLSLTSPSGGSRLEVNSTCNITWNETGDYLPSDTIKIEYSTNGINGTYKLCYDNITNQSGASVPASQGYFLWRPIPDDISKDVYIRLTRNADTVNVPPAFSDQISIIGKLIVTSPPALAEWYVNETYPIQWQRIGSIANVSISYYTEGTGWKFITFYPGGAGEYLWNIPNTTGINSANATAIIKVADASDLSVYNESAGFRILPKFVINSPTSGEKLVTNRAYTISWSTFGDVSNVSLYYSTNAFANESQTYLICATAPNIGTYQWQVNDTLSNNVKIRIVYPQYPDARNYSDVFRIVPNYTVIAPYSSGPPYNHKWPVSTVQQIKWNCTSGNASYVHIYYSTDGGLTYPNVIAENVSNNYPAGQIRTYNWTVIDPITTGFRVKIQDADAGRTDINATSPYNSKIMGYFNITSPNGGEIFVVNQPLNIYWQRAGAAVTNATLNISTDDFNTSTLIVANTENDGFYAWTVPDMISDTVKIRVADINDPDAYDQSDNYFKIRGAFEVIEPKDGDRLPIGYNTTIKWNTTGNITKVNIIAYSTQENDPRFNYTVDNPYVIVMNYSNNGNGQTNYTWLVPDNATNTTRIRIIDSHDSSVYAESSGNFSMIGSFNILSPNGGESWVVDSYRNITWVPTGSSITEARIMYSINGSNGPWLNISEDYGTPNDGIVANNGTFAWLVPDSISKNVYIKIEDPLDPTVNDTSNSSFTIRGNFSIISPAGGERWVTNEANRTINWTTTGTIPKVDIYYFKGGNLSTLTPIALNLTNNGYYNWIIPDDRNNTVQIMLQDPRDTSWNVTSNVFKIDYYNITWMIRDFLSALPIAGGLSVNDTSGWVQSGLSSETPILHPTPYGYWTASWSHPDYGDKAKNYIADSDQNFTIYLESKVVHVWEARTEYVYEPDTHILRFRSALLRDGSMAGAKDEYGNFSTIANFCRIEIYSPSGEEIYNLSTTNVTPSGFFSLDWYNATNWINTSVVYFGITDIRTILGGIFRTPFMLDLTPTVSLYNATQRVAEYIDVPLSAFQQNVTQILTNQTQIIETKMNETVQVITNASQQMQESVNATLQSFENRTYAAIETLQAGANQTLLAAQQATEAAGELEATAKKYSWNAVVSPNPVLVGDKVTLSLQGPSGYLPVLDIYSWDNKVIVNDYILTESAPGLYQYEFTVDSARFTPGKSYTYIITESQTGGLVTGSGLVESMSITTVAGLAAAAPEAERAAKKALEAIQAVEAVLTSGEKINIGLTLKNLQESVEKLPETIAKEGPSATIVKTINEIAERIKAIAGEEGFDFSQMLEEALGESPTIKEIRSKTEAIQSVIQLLQMLFEAKFGGLDTPVVSTSIHGGSVIFRISALNPSKTKTQKVQVKVYLPQEVKPKDIIDLGGLDLEFDAEKGCYYVYKDNLELGPAELRIFNVEVEDVWVIPEEKLQDLKKRTDSIMSHLEKSEYYEQAKPIAESIYNRINQIKAMQADETVSQQQHIGNYRQNLETIDKIKEDIARLEKILVTAGGPLSPEMLAKTKIKSESPTKTMTWIVIFSLITFVILLAGVLFFTWQRQARLTREEIISAKKASFPESESKEEEK